MPHDTGLLLTSLIRRDRMSAASNNRSMSQAFGALFGTVTTTASAISTSVNAAGNLFEELEQRSSSRLRSVGLEISLAEEEKQVRLVKESALRTSEFLLESARKLAANPTWPRPIPRSSPTSRRSWQPSSRTRFLSPSEPTLKPWPKIKIKPQATSRARSRSRARARALTWDSSMKLEREIVRDDTLDP